MTSAPAAADPKWVDVTIAGVRRPGGEDASTKVHTVVLKEAAGERELPISMLATAAVSLAAVLESVEMPRPMTHQLATDLLGAAGGRISEVRITALLDGTFYAVVGVAGPDGARDVDARPSDALNLASISDAPIRVDERVLVNPSATASSSWRDYPTTESDIAEEVRRNLQRRSP